MLRSLPRAVPLLVLLGALTSSTPADAAGQACRAAFGAPLVSSSPGTVSDVRGFTEGGGMSPPWTMNAFPDAARTDPVAWCWILVSAKPWNIAYQSWAIGPHGDRLLVGGIIYPEWGPLSPPPSRVPEIP